MSSRIAQAKVKSSKPSGIEMRQLQRSSTVSAEKAPDTEAGGIDSRNVGATRCPSRFRQRWKPERESARRTQNRAAVRPEGAKSRKIAVQRPWVLASLQRRREDGVREDGVG